MPFFAYKKSKKATTNRGQGRMRVYGQKARAPATRNTLRAGAARQYMPHAGRPLPIWQMASPTKQYEFKVLPYCQATSLVAGVAGVTGTLQQFRLNSIFDPDFTGVGHQPYGHDELEPFWAKYKVYRVDIKIEWTLPTASSAVYGMAAVNQPGDTYNYAGRSLNTVTEKPGCNCIRVPNADGGSTQPATFQGSWAMHTLCGVTKTMFDADQTSYAAAMGANPAGTPLLSMATLNASAINATSVVARVQINYHVMFYDRKTLDRSP